MSTSNQMGIERSERLIDLLCREFSLGELHAPKLALFISVYLEVPAKKAEVIQRYACRIKGLQMARGMWCNAEDQVH